MIIKLYNFAHFEIWFLIYFPIWNDITNITNKVESEGKLTCNI